MDPDPAKRWKFDPADLEVRRRWDDHQAASTEAIERTSTAFAPCYVVPADRKWFRDLAVSEILVRTLDGLAMTHPPPDPASDGLVVEWGAGHGLGAVTLPRRSRHAAVQS